VRYVVELPPDCRIDVRMVVAVNVRPDRRIAIDVFAALAVAQERTASLDQNQRLIPKCAPFGHISERMPDEPLVPFDQLVGVPLSHARLAPR
jgi:hypothetical protein